VALLAEGDDIVVKGLEVAVGDDGTPKAVYLRPFLEMRLVAELLTQPKRVMVCWVCMVFLLFARSLGTYIPKGRERCAAPKSRHSRVAKRRSFWKGTRSLRGGRSPKPEGRGMRVLNAEPKGAAPAPERWPSDRAKRRYEKLPISTSQASEPVEVANEDGKHNDANEDSLVSLPTSRLSLPV
jgi:hypothetical protein